MKNIYVYVGVLVAMVIIFWQRKPIETVILNTMDKLTRSQFIEKFGPMVTTVSRGSGLFPSVTMAQAILESGNGNSSLSREAYNYFGIKADKSWKGNFVVKPTTEYVNGKPVKVEAKFRAYGSPGEGFLDRVDFLKSMPRYKNAGVFIAPTPEAQAIALQKAGYATDPSYSNLLIQLINQNNLKRFDV